MAQEREAEQLIGHQARSIEAEEIEQRIPSRRVSRHNSARHPTSINVPYTGSHCSASCHGVGNDRNAKIAATSACATAGEAERANKHHCRPAPGQRAGIQLTTKGLSVIGACHVGFH